jgi:hypothetical protein
VWNSRKAYFLCFLGILVGGALSLSAQTTRVSGKVIDKNTKEAVIGAHVYFQGTKTGTTTDIDGLYTLDSYYSSDSVVVSALGYRTIAKAVKRDKAQTVDFELEEDSKMLNTFVVQAPDVDPAIAILRNILRYKDVNNREKLESYQYEVYNKVEFDLNNIDEKFMNRKVLKPINFIFSNLDSNSTKNSKPYLPLFITESISEYYFRKNPRTHKEFIKATKVSGIENESISQFLGDMYQNINIYDNMVSVFGKSFVSPISDRAQLYYDFYLLDSAFIGNDWCYNIRFVPKRKQEPTFIGDFWVNDTTFAIRKVEAGLSEDAPINFIQYFEFVQEFEQVENEVWMLSRDFLLVDFKLMDSDKQMGFYGRKTTSYKNHLINKPKESEFYSGPQNIIVADDAEEKTDEYWHTARHDTLSENEEMIYHLMDTIQSMPQVKSFVSVMGMLINGYKVFGPVEWGPYFTTMSFNKFEGPRFRIGGRTSNNFSRRFELNGYVAYGTRDEKWKYSGGFRYMISKKPNRQLISFQYKYDLEQLGISSNAFRSDNLLASVFRINPANKLSMVEEFRGSYEYEYFEGLSNQLQFRRRSIAPLGDNKYIKAFSPNESIELPYVTISEFTYYLRFAKDEKFISGEFERVSLGTKKPVIDIQYSLGIKDLFGSNYGYHKVVLSYTHWFPIGTLGWGKYHIEGGKYWGNIGFPALEIHRGNETFYFDEQAFNTMLYLEFVSDQYVSAWYTHHFDGFFLNHIPLLRRLKWREVAGVKAIFGSISEANTQEVVFPSYMHQFTVPFVEAHVGVENIFKFLQVDFIWRFNYLDHPDIVKYGLRFKFDVYF